jgi:hypothetical protein
VFPRWSLLLFINWLLNTVEFTNRQIYWRLLVINKFLVSQIP